MGLTEQVLAKYTACSEPFDPWGKSDHENDEWEIAEDYEHTNPYFDRDCPTNLAMLDIWCEKFQKDIPFVPPAPCFLPLTKWHTGSPKRDLHAAFLYTPAHSRRSFLLKIRGLFGTQISWPKLTGVPSGENHTESQRLCGFRGFRMRSCGKI